ncbi:peptidylprolyl isomerase [Winogradskyella haliclonae]|uniref:Peptidyl-prolyl cis-trans isomerase n=1 Tax=Winogradskyella haliclonae TaxID=2048558 RepID=A0ABQ2BXN4_9FLAO|nr:peptidylprolyl isomerase [Winogradskyella haliclonae]GGI57251.1 peptidyl-prolyl cis-trans isomerase [Winogradskyella haliclonae]
MRIKFLNILLIFLCLNLSHAQKQQILLTIDDDVVTSDEFMKLYNKNLDLVKDESQKQLDNYLELFVNYKLKLKEAVSLGLDKDENYKREFENYKKQLTKNYLSDNKVTDDLVKETYDRMQYDVKASHILILDNPEEEDTLVAYNKLLEYRKTLQEKGFESAKEQYHNGKTVLVEDLGYFSTFKMVYDFESKAYETKPGDVSMPFKTDFGYHVVRVDEKRPSRGTATAAHIMIADKQKDSTINPKERIKEIYKKLQQGESFEALAKQFSDDKSSARSGGKLRAFKSGQLSSTVFEDAAFALENPGDVTEPIKTKYGWHIIKLISKEAIKGFDELKPTLEAQIKRDARSKLINSAMVEELSKRYKIARNPKTKAYFKSIIAESYLAGKFDLPEDYNGSDVVLSVNDAVFTNNDFLQHLKAKQRQYMRQQVSIKKILDKELELFHENSVLKFREDNLENENQEFADILQEYRDGLLLFALMEKQIWNKASKDTIGLKTYYEANKAKYIWEDRVDVIIASSGDKAIAKSVQNLVKSGKTQEEIKKALNSNDKQNVIFTSGVFEVSNSKLPKDMELVTGVSDIYEHNQAYHVINIKEILLSGNKTLEDAKGSVVNDYQNKIEEDWLLKLREKFKVDVDKKVLKQLKSKINN